MLDIRNSWDINKSHLLFDNGNFCGTLELKVQHNKIYNVTKNGKIIHQGLDMEEANSVYDSEYNRSSNHFN